MKATTLCWWTDDLSGLRLTTYIVEKDAIDAEEQARIRALVSENLGLDGSRVELLFEDMDTFYEK